MRKELMHLDIGQIITWVIGVFRLLQQLLGFRKGALETAKTAKASCFSWLHKIVLFRVAFTLKG